MVSSVECRRSRSVLRNWIRDVRLISFPSLMLAKPAVGLGQSALPAHLWQGGMDLTCCVYSYLL